MKLVITAFRRPNSRLTASPTVKFSVAIAMHVDARMSFAFQNILNSFRALFFKLNGLGLEENSITVARFVVFVR